MKLKIILITILSIMVLVFTGCSQTDVDTNPEEVENIGEWSITIEVVGEDPIEFTNEDAQEIGAAEIVAAQKDGENMLEADTWKGVLLCDVLDYIGVEEYSVISVEAADGYSKEMEPDKIDDQATGFGWMVNGVMLDEECGPIQLINNGRGPKWWIKQVSKVTVIK